MHVHCSPDVGSKPVVHISILDVLPDQELMWHREQPDHGGFLDDFHETCLLYTSDAADEEDSVDLGGRRIIKKKKKKKKRKKRSKKKIKNKKKKKSKKNKHE
eukprot:TRINITY_DN8912_c0_g2_i9.p1 TRINITY_DN8912_c0_g2~~TRINITY_DN8912_c0_g2_i9.p1  ORF type:complete len:102 (+),score=36.56 TRINITY_DN8912_c0_g2_i9:395-700(+)